MKRFIIFGSQYGTAKSYAQKLSQLTDIECISYDKIKNRLDVESVIYIGGLYAGGVKGLKTTMKYLPESADLTVVTVGLADVNDPVNVEKILHSLRSQLAHDRYIKTKFFHLRGGINYRNLTLLHRTMMSLLYQTAKKKDPKQLTEEDKVFLDSYNQQVNFVDFYSLKPICEWIVNGSE